MAEETASGDGDRDGKLCVRLAPSGVGGAPAAGLVGLSAVGRLASLPMSEQGERAGELETGETGGKVI